MLRRNRTRKEGLRAKLNKHSSSSLPHEAGLVEVETEIERTHKVSQKEIVASVAEAAKRNAWEHELSDHAPFGVCCSRNGRHALIHGRAGYLAGLDLHSNTTVNEFRTNEVVRGAVYLHDETMYAAAQKKYVYVYDSSGTELHRLKQHIEPEHLDFLPFHFLLASVGRSGFLKYVDTSTGTLCSEHNTKLGSAHCMAQNPQTAVLHLGHSNGVVTLWSPAAPQPLARILAHRGTVTAAACSFDGSHFVTAGLDGYVKVWDARMFKVLSEKRSKASVVALACSQRGMLAAATLGGNVTVHQDARNIKPFSPYLSHRLGGGRKSSSVCFRPYEDALLIGHSAGVTSIIVPGASEPNYDALEGANPFRSKKQRNTSNVRSLLDKLPPETIALGGAGFVGGVDRDPAQLDKDRHDLQDEADAHLAKFAPEKAKKKKMRGRSKIAAQLKRKSKNVITAETVLLRETLKAEKESAAAAREADGPSAKKRKTSDVNASQRPGPNAAMVNKSALDRLFSK
mmetsp:Transcript_18600/g.62789  ORF Transcript_18600/g.62789 Transcript_18600/m.62789 type:complete len:512 (-) Transcript_18600:50-1585(-)